MRYIALLVGLLMAISVQAQFPGTDSLRNYNNKYITNNPATAFTNLRLNTLVRGIIDWVDTARAGTGGGGALGVDTLWALNDSTIRYRKNGVFRNFVLKGVYDTRRKVDTIYRSNDSTLNFTINGTDRSLILPGNIGATQLTDSSFIVGNDTIIISGIGNLATANLTWTANRTHDAGGYFNVINNLDNWYLQTQAHAGPGFGTGVYSLHDIGRDYIDMRVENGLDRSWGLSASAGRSSFWNYGALAASRSLINVDSNLIALYTGGSNLTTNERMRIDASGNVGIGSNNPMSKVDIQTNALGTTQTNTSGLLLSNTTAAASAAQQISPAVRWRGNGWKTDATAASQPVDFRADVLPVQGTSSPTGVWRLQAAINDAAYSTRLQVANNAITGEFMSTGLRIAGAGLSFGGGTPVANNINWGSSTFNISPHSTVTSAINVLTFSGVGTATSDTTNWIRFNPTFQPTSGSGLFRSVIISPTINQTGGANGKTHGILIDPTLTSAADFRAIETVRGNAIFGTTSGNVLIGTSVDSGFKLDVTGNIRGTGSLELSTASEGVILKSPNGTRYKLTVENDGTLTTTAL